MRCRAGWPTIRASLTGCTPRCSGSAEKGRAIRWRCRKRTSGPWYGRRSGRPSSASWSGVFATPASRPRGRGNGGRSSVHESECLRLGVRACGSKGALTPSSSKPESFRKKDIAPPCAGACSSRPLDAETARLASEGTPRVLFYSGVRRPRGESLRCVPVAGRLQSRRIFTISPNAPKPSCGWRVWTAASGPLV